MISRISHKSVCVMLVSVSLGLLFAAENASAQTMEELAKPKNGRSMRSTSTALDEHGNYAHDNSDNSRVAPGAERWFWMPRDRVSSPTCGSHSSDPNDKPGHRRVRQTIRKSCYACFMTISRSRRSKCLSAISSATASASERSSSACRSSSRTGIPTTAIWHMPFRKSIRIEVVNQSSKPLNLLYYNIDWIKKDQLAEDTPYFYARYRQEYPVQSGKDYVLLETEGKGHYVGTVLAVRTRSPSWFGEGDEKIYIDGESTASIWGTGTEDYFLSAWGLKTTSTPYFGTPYFDQWGIVGGHTSAYRWHLQDPIVFNKSIKVTIEHWGWISTDENPEGKQHSWNEREDDFASVAFWYQTGQPSVAEPVPDAAARTLPNLDTISYAEGLCGSGPPWSGNVLRAG